jgi:hypothetical protein
MAIVAVAVGLLATPAVAAQPDKAKLDEARSLAAEAAAIEHLAAAGRITEAYAAGQRDEIEQDLKKLTPEPDVGRAATAALAALRRHDAAALAALVQTLVREEAALGRAP